MDAQIYLRHEDIDVPGTAAIRRARRRGIQKLPRQMGGRKAALRSGNAQPAALHSCPKPSTSRGSAIGLTGPVNPDFANTPPEVGHSPTGMHRPLSSEFDSEETAYQDEVQHDNALRDSVLRTPR